MSNMTGTVHIECKDGGFETSVELAHVGLMEKGHLISALLDGLEVDAAQWSMIKSMIDMDLFQPRTSRRKGSGSIMEMLARMMGEPEVEATTDDIDPVKRAKMMGLSVDEMPFGAAIGGSPKDLMEFLKSLSGGKE